jgi:two-component system, OmpR family, sensor kinase
MLSEQNSASSPTAHITRPLYLAPEAASSLQRIHRLQAQQSAEEAQDTTSRRPQTAVQGITASAVTLAGSKSQVGVQAAQQWRQRINRWLRPFFSLRWQIPFVFIALFVFLLLILSGFIYGSVATQLYNNGLAALPARVLGSNGVREQLTNDIYCRGMSPPTALRSVQAANESNDIDSIYLLDTRGQAIATSDSGGPPGQVFPYIDALSRSTGKSLQASSINGEPIGIFVTTLAPPLSARSCSRNTFHGYLGVATFYSAEHAILTRLMITIVIATIAIIAVGSAAVFFFTNLLLSPLRHMRDAAQAIALGDLKQRVRLPQSDDEVGALAVSFNEMIDQVEHAFEEQHASEGRTRRFVSDASHELRTPLTSLRGFTDVLMRGAKDDPETLQRSLKLMKNETERMSRLVNDLLTLARMDEGNPLKIERVNMLDIGAEAIDQTRILAADGRDVSLQLATEDEQLEVLADVDRLKQVLLILCDNALKYGRPGAGGWIVLAIDKQDNTILMHVVDNGKGIAEEDLPHVFERFYRGRNSPVSADGTPIAGAGLGLSIALAIIHAHRGDLTTQSEPGNTTFTVALPYAT